MIKVLEAVSDKNNWVSRHALKGVMHRRASPELLNYCLKYLGGKLAANGMVVQVLCHPNSNDAEYRFAPLSFVHDGDGLYKVHPSKGDIKHDLKFLLDSLLDPEARVNYGPRVTRESEIDAATKLLDCKQFLKDYRSDKMTPNNSCSVHIMCHI